MCGVVRDGPGATGGLQVPGALEPEWRRPWYRLELPLGVQLRASQADLRDVRVFNAAGEPQAYALARQQAQSTEQRNLSAVKWFPLYNSAQAGDSPPSVRVQSTPMAPWCKSSLRPSWRRERKRCADGYWMPARSRRRCSSWSWTGSANTMVSSVSALKPATICSIGSPGGRPGGTPVVRR